MGNWKKLRPKGRFGVHFLPGTKLLGQIFFFFIYLFIYFWLRWVFVAACGLSLVAASGGYSSLRCAGFSLRWLLFLRSTGSRHTGSVAVAHGLGSYSSRALAHRLSSCGTRAYLLRGMWDLPGPGLEPMCPALAGGYLTTAPPGKSQGQDFKILFPLGKTSLVSSLHFWQPHSQSLSPFRRNNALRRKAHGLQRGKKPGRP